MRVPESDRETDLTLGPAADEVANITVPTSGAPGIRVIPEHDGKQDDLNQLLSDARVSENRLREIIDAIPALAWCNHPDGSTEFLNRRWHEYTGLSMQEAHGGGWKAAVHPEDLPRLTSQWRTLRDLDPCECEIRVRRSDGVFRWFLFRVEARRDQTREIGRSYGMATDIEDRKQIESLRAAERRTLEMIADGESLKDILNDLCRSIDLEASPAISTVLLMDSDGERLWHTAGPLVPRGWLPAISPLIVSPHAGCCGAAALLKERVVVADVATDRNWLDEYRDLAIENGIRAAWSEPILTRDGDVLGTFALYSSEPRIPTEAEIELIEGARHIALIAIERQRSRGALTTALDTIRESEVRLRRIIDTIPTLVWCSSPDGYGEFWNQRWHDYTGLSPEAVRGSGWQSAIHPDDIKEIMDKWLGFLTSGQPGEVEGRLRRFDGEYRWFLFRAHPLRDNAGNIVNWYGANIDIDDRKRTEEQLLRDQEELRQITDAIPNPIIILDPDGKAIYTNRVALDYAGLTAEDVKTRDFRSLIIHPEDLDASKNTHQVALSRGVPFKNEQRALRKDGQYRWFLIQYNPLIDENGSVLRWYATATDIDDRKRNEDRSRNENLALREEIQRSSMFEEIVGSSEALRKVLGQVSKVAPTDSTVLILGETGTGKELIARAIHNRSKRSKRAFIRVNCAAIPPSLIGSELFGHEKGSFTGALQRRLGRFESADAGTLFLDEVGDLPLETQVALLRVLQEREFERLGGNQTVSVDVRVLAATNRDLSTAVIEGGFRQDLFYRLNVFPIRVPALRERVDDIPLLVEYLVDRYAQKAGKKIRNISKNTLDLFQTYDWPGNIRELQNVIERAVILCEGETFVVDEAWLPRGASKVVHGSAPLVANLVEREKDMIENAMCEAMGQVSGPLGAAAKLGIPRQTLESKIRKLGINRHRFKTAQPPPR